MDTGEYLIDNERYKELCAEIQSRSDRVESMTREVNNGVLIGRLRQREAERHMWLIEIDRLVLKFLKKELDAMTIKWTPENI